MAKAAKGNFVCQNCGAVSPRWAGKCASCGEWNTIVEEAPSVQPPGGGIAKALVARGSLNVWRYAVRKADNGDLEMAPLHKVGLISTESLRVEPYPTPLKVLPIDESKK